MEHSKSKSTQPRSETTSVTLQFNTPIHLICDHFNPISCRWKGIDDADELDNRLGSDGEKEDGDDAVDKGMVGEEELKRRQERIEREQWLQANKKKDDAAKAPDADADDEEEEDSQVDIFGS